MEIISYYIKQLYAGIEIKVFTAFICSMYINAFRGDVLVLDFYLVVAGVDLALGLIKAHVYGTFNPKYLLYWVRKLITHLILVTIFGMICYAISASTGVSIGLANYMLLICIVTEAGSIVENLTKLGCPIPAPLKVFMKLIRSHVAKKITVVLDGNEHMRRELESALYPEKIAKQEKSETNEKEVGR